MHQQIKKLILYGAGIRCSRLCSILQDTDIEQIEIVDSDSRKWGSEIQGYIISSPEILYQMDDFTICITIEDRKVIQKIKKELEERFCLIIKNEVSYEELLFIAYQRNILIQKKITEPLQKISNNQNIIFDCLMGLGLGGVEAWTTNLCESLILKGYTDTYIISKKDTYNCSTVLSNNILYVDRDNEDKFSISTIEKIIDRLVDKLPCKIVTSQIDEVLLGAMLLKKRYPDLVKVISVIHNGDENTFECHMDLNRYVDVFIGVSEEIQSEMLKRGLEKKRIQFMTCPFVCEKEISRSYTEDRTMPIRIGYAGRMDKVGILQKRMDLLLQFARALAEKNVNYIFELAGDGPARKEMEEFVRSNNLEKRVQFLGTLNRSEISSFWKRQDIFVNFADFEGRCISKLEAMANGAVPITTNTVGTREDIEDGVNGFIVSLGDYETMVERVVYLETHRERLKEMGILAHDKIFPKSIMDDHIAFWEKMLDLT